MKTLSNDTLIQKYNLTLGTYYFYQKYIIAEIKEGEVINLKKLDDLIPVILKHFGEDQPFIYISDRIHSHSIIPIDYLKCPFNEMPNFKGYGVVTYNLVSEKSVEVEKHFAKKPFYNFKNLKDAVKWAKKETI